MNAETFNRAKELEEIIRNLDIVLKISPNDFRISEHYFSPGSLKTYEWTHIVPNEIIMECMEVIKKHRDMYQKEFDELFAEVKQEHKEPQFEELPKNVDNVSVLSKKPWYKFW